MEKPSCRNARGFFHLQQLARRDGVDTLVKKTLLIPALLLVLLSAAWAGPDKLVNIKADRTPLPVVLKSLAKQMGYNIYLTPNLGGEVSTDLHQVPGFGALELILSTQPEELTFKVVDKTIVVGPPAKIQKLPATLYR